MKNTKRSITLKVLTGYIMIGLLVVVAIYFIYPQIKTFIYPPKKEQATNQKLTFTSNALSYLYEAETIGRTAMATGSQRQFKEYQVLVDSIKIELDSLQRITDTKEQNEQLDSIKMLLSNKTSNIRAMVRLRDEQYSRNYYDEALDELVKEDIYFEDYANDPRLDSVDPYIKSVIVDFNEYIRKDTRDEDQGLKSMAETVRKTLSNIEARKKELEIDIINRENTLLANDRNINLKIRNLLSTLEREGSFSARQREAFLNSRIQEITKTLKIIGIISVVLAIGFVIMIFKDASRSQQYSKNLEQSNATAQSLLKSREQLMATITHDMRSPLNTVLGFTDLLKKTAVDAKQMRYLDTVQKSGDYILKLVNDLLDFAKLEAGKISIEKIPFNPKKLIEDVIVVSLPQPLKEGVEIRTEIPDELDAIFLSDPFRIKQILANLITNAYKFTEEGSITIALHKDGKNLRFKVIDTGCGIPKEKQQLIFKEFSQAEETTQRKYGGFGLGLSISQKLTELLNGKLQLKSIPGKGSTFTLIVPVEQTEQQEPADFEEDLSEVKLDALRRILIVDDEPVQQQLTKATLAPFNLKVDTASNGKEALQQLEKNEYDLILSDIQMPVMNGIEFIKALKANSRSQDIPVIALSGNETLKQADYKHFGFAANLRKPYKPAALIAILKGLSSTEIEEQQNIPSTATTATTSGRLYDLKQLKAFTADDNASLKNILIVFAESTAESLSQLKEHREDPEQLNQVAHKMLPMMRQLEADDVVQPLVILEKPDLENKSAIAIQDLVQQTIEQTELLLKQLKQDQDL